MAIPADRRGARGFRAVTKMAWHQRLLLLLGGLAFIGLGFVFWDYTPPHSTAAIGSFTGASGINPKFYGPLFWAAGAMTTLIGLIGRTAKDDPEEKKDDVI